MEDLNQNLKNLLIGHGRIFTFVDFGNVNYWFRHDQKDGSGNLLNSGQLMVTDIVKFGKFIDNFSNHKRFYYGIDIRQKSTWHITKLAEKVGFRVVKKPIQWVRHYLAKSAAPNKKDFIELPKCNFDVELTIDALRLSNHYDTFAIFSGDSDFSILLRHLRGRGKKIILFYSGNISHRLRNHADILINAQKIKEEITRIKIKKESHQ